MKLVFFDTETGGLEPCHPTIQIAAVAAEYPALTELEASEVKLTFDPKDANPESLELNHYDPVVWESAVSKAVTCQRFAEFLKRHADMPMVSRAGKPYTVARLVGHNAASFDGPRLQAMFKECGQFLPASFQVLDTLQRANWYFLEHPDLQRPSLALPSLVDYFGLTVDGAHDALADSRMALAVYREIIAQESRIP